MNVWKQIEQTLARHAERLKLLKALAREGRKYLTPRYRAPGIWILRSRDKVAGRHVEHLVLNSFEEAKASLEPEALRMRAVREAAAEAKAAEAKRRRDELTNRKKGGGGKPR